MTPQQIEALERLTRLKEQGSLTDNEFEEGKRRILSQPIPLPARKSKPGAVWGLIALVASVLLLFTPRFLVTPVLIAVFAFAVVGLFRDSSKFPALLSLVPAFFIIYTFFGEALDSSATYRVEYEAYCIGCTVRYSNGSGGTDEEAVSSSWKQTVSARGDDFLSLSAQNSGENTGTVQVVVRVDGKKLTEKSSSGRFAVAQVHFRPKESPKE